MEKTETTIIESTEVFPDHSSEFAIPNPSVLTNVIGVIDAETGLPYQFRLKPGATAEEALNALRSAYPKAMLEKPERIQDGATTIVASPWKDEHGKWYVLPY